MPVCDKKAEFSNIYERIGLNSVIYLSIALTSKEM